MAKCVYIETTIASYLTARYSRDLLRVARQEITQEWWDKRRGIFDLYISAVVIEEASEGDPEAAERRLEAPLRESPCSTCPQKSPMWLRH